MHEPASTVVAAVSAAIPAVTAVCDRRNKYRKRLMIHERLLLATPKSRRQSDEGRVEPVGAATARLPCLTRPPFSSFQGLDATPFRSPRSLTSEKFNPVGIDDTSHNLFSGERSESAARKG